MTCTSCTPGGVRPLLRLGLSFFLAILSSPLYNVHIIKLLLIARCCQFFTKTSVITLGMVQIDVTIFTQYTLLSPSGLFQQTGVHARTSRAFFLEEVRVEHS